MTAVPDLPYRRLSVAYFFYFAILGSFIPYFGVYLKTQGYSATAIGQLLAVVMGTKIIAPNLWAWLIHRSARGMLLLRLATVLAALLFAGAFVVEGFWPLVWVLAGYSFFWHAVLPQLEVLTLDHLGRHRVHRYSQVRLWGSIGFIVAVAGIGLVLEGYRIEWLPSLVFGLLAALAAATWTVPAAPGVHLDHTDHGLLRALRNPAAIARLGSCFLMQASHGPYYGFFTIFLEDLGYRRSSVGLFWAFGVLAEVGVFLVVHHWLKALGAARLLALSMAITAARWVIIAIAAKHTVILVAAQLLHAASYGVFHAAAIHLLHSLFPGRAHTQGQALYSSLSFGLGGAIGSLASGVVWDSLGGHVTFALASFVAAAAALVVVRWLYPAKKP